MTTDERAPAGKSRASSKRWAIGHRQFDLVRADTGDTYLTRWWLVKTPWGGICVHRMMAGDARETVHDHPFVFVAFVLRGGYIERRLNTKTLTIDEAHRIRWVNRMRRDDAHSIQVLTRTPTWTLLVTGRHRRAWGFWEPTAEVRTLQRNGDNEAGVPQWRWTHASYFDSGHYVP